MATPFNILAPLDPATIAANQVKLSGNQLFKTMLNVYTNNFNAVWNNPNATPDKVVSAFGTEAQKVFALSAGLAAYLVSAGAVDGSGNPTIPTTMPAGWNYSANADGSIVLTPIS